MRPHHRPIIEWAGVATIAIIAVIIYVLFTSAQRMMPPASTPIAILAELSVQGTLMFTNVILLMIFATLITLIIVEVRIHKKMEEVEMAVLKKKKKVGHWLNE